MEGNRGEIKQQHWYEHVPKLAETSPESKVNILRNQQVQPT